MKHVTAGVLEVAYREERPADGPPVLLLHGFPYDIHSYDTVSDLLAADGYRVIVPFLRGYAPTRFRSAQTPRSGEQAVLGTDLLALMDALGLPTAILAGYDWGGRAACVVAALWPHRARGLVTCTGYNIQDISAAMQPSSAEQEYRLWYQYYFHSERGRAGLEADRRGVCRLLWRLWSPSWPFDDAVFEQSAAAFPTIRISSRWSLTPTGTGSVWCRVTRARPRWSVRWPPSPPSPCRASCCMARMTACRPRTSSARAGQHFTGPYERRVIPATGHNVPQEAPVAFAAAIRDLAARP